MQSQSSTAGAEALRWLGVAENLLASRDLVGSKTFAIRARESDPRLEAADQILAVTDTLLAGEKRINNQHDWYAILQLVRQTDDSELIASQYRRLALSLNPHKNKLPFADQAFKLISDAWSVLSNPSQKFFYDNDLNLQANSTPSRVESTRKETPSKQNPRKAATKYVNRTTTNISGTRNSTHRATNYVDESSSFWTACPYCYNMFEYPSAYVDCTLRCQKCWRAFHAVVIQTPPPIQVVDGKEAYLACWGFFPLAMSAAAVQKSKARPGGPNWTPFSGMIACSPEAVGITNTGGVGGSSKNKKEVKNSAKKSSGPRIYVDEEDVYVELSSSGGEDPDFDPLF